MTRQVIIGAGEVGVALREVLDVELVDINGHIGSAEVLHIAFPWSPTFDLEVKRYAQLYQAELVIVHSTVPPGTCDEYGWVHSPVRGRHPELEAGLRAFTKHAGGAQAERAAEVLRDAGLDVAVTPLAVTTEIGKLWELIAFGLQVAVEHAVYDTCQRYGADHDVAYQQMALTYNHGYAKLGEERFVRPVLDHVEGPIGGHCIVASSWLLDHPLAELIRQVR